MFRVEVKTSSYLSAKGSASKRSRLFGHTYQWIMSSKHEEIVDPSLFYCFVNMAGEKGTTFRFFVVSSRVVAGYVGTQHRIWLEADPSHKDTDMRTFRLALDSEGYPLPTPSANCYEDDWSFSDGGLG